MESCECLTCSLGRISKARHDQAELDQLDAQRYRKLKAFHKSTDRDKWDDLWNSYSNLDAAVDALPDANENPNRSR